MPADVPGCPVAKAGKVAGRSKTAPIVKDAMTLFISALHLHLHTLQNSLSRIYAEAAPSPSGACERQLTAAEKRLDDASQDAIKVEKTSDFK